MEKTDCGNVLRRTWEITWRHKVLWLFGFLASLNTRFRFDVESEIPPVRHLRHWVAEFVSSPSFGPVVVGLFLFFLLVSLVFSILKALGRSGLVNQVNQIENGSTPTVQAGWQAAKRYGWRVFWGDRGFGRASVYIGRSVSLGKHCWRMGASA